MSFIPFVATVSRTQRLSPHFQRVTFAGLEDMGPAGPILDLRIKLLIPGTHSLPKLTRNWYATWSALPEAERGFLRTYSIRNRRHSEIDIDFVLHADSPGPASTWAANAAVGDQLIIIAPEKDDNDGVGIEFAPGYATTVRMYGDQTALPAIARIVDEWPAGVTGHIDIESPDILPLQTPPGVDIVWHPQAHGELMANALRRHLGLPLEHFALTPVDDDVWETPLYSSSGDLICENTSNGECYYWIAGNSGVVTSMRRTLVKTARVPRNQVSFMGYWR